ncbi:hypothetical protein SUGI_0132860 [Cryptomeria japonica]|uniref:U-box domain-containing protein 33 isoform X2 n=1 Tax=Cryptomeria japonica TaxID=3369 RepID=UPI002408B823|nr:U-box domain-containing protein 33 isoform X2 [Cryptomeria japonica]GLJ10679.1 hypothetical protein SUGI_0132860 [Cryptomeria japonica]
MASMEDLEALLAEIEIEHSQEIETALEEIERLKGINNCLMREKDDAIIKLQDYMESRPRIETSPSSSANLLYRIYSLNDIKSATGDFSEHLKVGEGDYGVVYKGEIEETGVAVKIRRENGFNLDQQIFHQQMDVLRDVRHVHLVRVVGECLDRGCIVSEYMVNGSLADRLFCKNGTSPLVWHVRVRIASEVCSALHFLHSLKPNGNFHCNLKPENILLDEFNTSKISDSGMAKLLPQESLIRGNISYLDPEYQRTGEFTDKSDVYSLGIIILQLLTGQKAFGLVRKVSQSLETGHLDDLLDPLAGEWPFDQALHLAYLALECTAASQQDRPNLHPTLTNTLDELQATASAIVQPAPTVVQPASIIVQPAQERQVPSLYTCPISHEVMDDPHFAADGFTYELEAIKEWFDSGHNTSPMTNARVDHTNLLPNRSLKSAIQEWKEANCPQGLTS